MKEKILITGGLGFIGHHLTKKIIETNQEADITIVDNLSSTLIDYTWIKHKAKIFIEDIIEFQYPETYDKIFHLASPVGSLGIMKRNGFIAREIILATHSVARAAIEMGAELLFVSSSEVYGHDGIHAESAPKVVDGKQGTRREYALGKLISEEILHNLALESRLSFKIFRPFNVFGEYQDATLGFVIPTFFKQALKGIDLTVFYDGDQRRSFCYVADIVDAILSVDKYGKAGEIYNIGNESNTVTIYELAKRIVEMTSSKSNIINIDPVEVYGQKYCEAFDKIPNIGKIKSEVSWQPNYDLNMGLKLMFDFYSNTGE